MSNRYVVIVERNEYGLPIGKVFRVHHIKDGDASPYPVEVQSDWPTYGHGPIYQFARSEVQLLPEGEWSQTTAADGGVYGLRIAGKALTMEELLPIEGVKE